MQHVDLPQKCLNPQGVEMKHGIIFSYDAMLAIVIVALLFASVSLFNNASENDGKTRAAMYAKSTDAAQAEYLLGIGSISSSTKENVNCSEVFDYNSQNKTSAKVKKCTGIE